MKLLSPNAHLPPLSRDGCRSADPERPAGRVGRERVPTEQAQSPLLRLAKLTTFCGMLDSTMVGRHTAQRQYQDERKLLALSVSALRRSIPEGIKG